MYHVSAQGVDERRMILNCTLLLFSIIDGGKTPHGNQFLEIVHPVVTVMVDWA